MAFKKKLLPDPLLIALTFLTRLPFYRLSLKQQVHWSEKNQGDSLLYYPLVGAFLALTLFFLIWLLPSHLSSWLSSTLVVLAWVLLTGGLHLDGLADSVDAACAAHRYIGADGSKDAHPHKEKILKIFKDPAAGPMAVLALVLLLLLKIVLLAELFSAALMPLLAALVLSRVQVIALFLTTPYLRSEGTGAALASHIPRTSCCLVIAISLALAILVLSVLEAFFVLLALTLVLFSWRSYWVKKIGGFVGDCAGALIEISEVTVLLVLCLLV